MPTLFPATQRISTSGSSLYQRLSTTEDIPLSTLPDDRPQDKTNAPVKRRWKPRVLNTLFLSLNVALLLLNGLFLLLKEPPGPLQDQVVYSPAASAIVYKPVVFSSAFGVQRSVFQGHPSDTNNKLWEDLYDFGITRLSATEARPMANKTLPIPDAQGGYVVQLAVFHQLHCLNLLRRGIYGEVDLTNKDDLLGIEHLDHCVDILRQGIMCTADVTPLTFARQSKLEPMKAVAEVTHVCRDFAQLQLWALERRVQNDIDKYTIVTDNPLGWGGYEYTPGYN